MDWKKHKYVLAIILLLSACKLFLVGDIRITESHDIAQEMLSSGEFKYWLNGGWNYNYQFPVYPFLLFTGYLLFNSTVTAILLNLILSAISAWIIWLIGLQLFQAKKYSYLIVLGFLLHPIILFYQIGAIHPFGLDLLIMLLLIAPVFLWHHWTYQRAVLFGALLGLAILNRPTLVVFALPVGISLLNQLKIRKLVGYGSIILLLGSFPMSMWLVRNYSHYETISINSSKGQNLWIGIQEETEGTAQLQNGESYYSLLSKQELENLSSMHAISESDFFENKYESELRQTPGLFSKMYLQKLKNFWWFRSTIGVDYPASTKPLLIWYKIAYSILLVFGIVGLLIGDKKLRIILLSMLLLSLFQAYFYVETRHRILIEPLLILGCVSLLSNQLFRRKNAV